MITTRRTTTTKRSTRMSPAMAAPYGNTDTCTTESCTNGSRVGAPVCTDCEAVIYHEMMTAPINYSDECNCTLVHDSISVCTYCRREPMTISINNMPDDVSMVTTPQLTNLAHEAYVGQTALRSNLSELMHDIRLECLDELARRSIRL